MSIVTYENVDTPVFEIDFLRYLFANGESGLLLSYQPDHLYADVDKTVPATIGGGIASFDDLSGNAVAGPQPTSTARPIFRASPARGEYDLADDVLPKDATLPAITDGTVILIGQQGIWIDEGYSFAGGNWSLGPTTYPNGPTGIIGIVGDMLDLVVLDRPLTADEQDKVVAYGVKRGSAGLIELGPELVVNGDFSDGLEGWQYSPPFLAEITENGMKVYRNSGTYTLGPSQDILTAGHRYRGVFEVSETPNLAQVFMGATGTAALIFSIPGKRDTILIAGGGRLILTPQTGNTTATYRYASLRRLIMPGETP